MHPSKTARALTKDLVKIDGAPAQVPAVALPDVHVAEPVATRKDRRCEALLLDVHVLPARCSCGTCPSERAVAARHGIAWRGAARHNAEWIVTSAWHVRGAAWCCNATGASITAALICCRGMHPSEERGPISEWLVYEHGLYVSVKVRVQTSVTGPAPTTTASAAYRSTARWWGTSSHHFYVDDHCVRFKLRVASAVKASMRSSNRKELPNPILKP
eukprot:362294-Chlamydomonas_euryale.AAC.7